VLIVAARSTLFICAKVGNDGADDARASGNAADWANESFALAKAAWVSDSGSVDEQYYRRQIKVADERLALAGLRLAALLNEVLGHVSPREFRH